MLSPAYIIDAVRSPIGKYGGKLSSVRPDDLFAYLIQALLNRNPQIDPNLIEDVVVGASNQAGEDCRNIARMAGLLAGLPMSVGGNTVNRLCGSGMQAIMDVARAISCGEGMFYIAGGVESMSRAPFIVAKSEGAFSRKMEMIDSTIGWRFTNNRLLTRFPALSMGETAEHIALQYQISRNRQDEYALQSQLKYQQALQAGNWSAELIPIPLSASSHPDYCHKDEQPRSSTTIDTLKRLPAAFVPGGTVTAGNCSGINDGASALLLACEEAVRLFNLKPLASIKSMAIAGVHPSEMGLGPIPATQKALQRAGLSISDIGLIELCEAFAATSIACIDQMGLDEQLINVNGGSIAMGNPLGSSGARIVTTLVHEMQRRTIKYGLATMGVGLGQGTSLVMERY